MASSSRLLLLRRSDHNSRLTEGFETLLDKDCMTDVTLTCGQQLIRAHRTVLSIFSPFFKRVFDSMQSPMQFPFIVLKDMPYIDLMAIIDLMYRGEVTVSQDQFTSLKNSAKVLEVSELSDIINSYEERTDIKPKVEENISSSARNTRKRGRPRRYCEDSEEEFKLSDTPPPPPTKRQQAMRGSAASTATTSSKKTIVQTITPTVKTPTATRGGAHLSFSKQTTVKMPTAIRGGHSAFSKPQTATRGGHKAANPPKPPPIRGSAKGSTTRGRNSRVQYMTEVDEDFDPSQELIRRNSGRRGRVGRPPRTASMTREDDMPMATSLPVSLPEPISVDLGNIFPNYNLNDVSSSTSTAPKNTVSVQFEQTIKQEPDSDSEVECIMSGTSPLPSGVMDEAPEITESSVNEVSTNSESQALTETTTTCAPIVTHNEATVDVSQERIDVDPESARSEDLFIESEVGPNIMATNITIKTERIEEPVPEIRETINQTQESSVSSVRRNSENFEEVVTNIEEVVTNAEDMVQTTALEEQPLESVSVSTPSVSSAKEVRDISSVPLLRLIKRERISPAPEVQTSFQTIDGQNNDESNSCETEVTSVSTVPVLSRVKMERISPQNVANDQIIDISAENPDNSQTANDSSDVSSSHNPDLNVQITSVFSAHQSPPHTQTNDRQSNCETATDTTECTSSSGQPSNSDKSQSIDTQNTNIINEIDEQDIGFECFYGSDDQQMHTYTSEATSSATFTTNDVNSFLGFNTTPENTIDRQNSEFTQIIPNNRNEMSFATTSVTNSIISSSDPTQQQFYVNTTQQITNTSNTSNTFSLDNNNVVMNSPLHSDEECMLLDSPQQSTQYEVTIGSEPNLDDSMDNL